MFSFILGAATYALSKKKDEPSEKRLIHSAKWTMHPWGQWKRACDGKAHVSICGGMPTTVLETTDGFGGKWFFVDDDDGPINMVNCRDCKKKK